LAEETNSQSQWHIKEKGEETASHSLAAEDEFHKRENRGLRPHSRGKGKRKKYRIGYYYY